MRNGVQEFMSKGMEDITTRKIDDSDEMPREVFTGSAP